MREVRIPGRRGSMDACTRGRREREKKTQPISYEDRPRVCSTPVGTQEMGNTIVECLGFATPPVVLPPEEKERIEKAFDEISSCAQVCRGDPQAWGVGGRNVGVVCSVQGVLAANERQSCPPTAES